MNRTLTDILERIVAYKKEEIRLAMQSVSRRELEKKEGFNRPVYSLREFLLKPEKTGIIAEFKRKSPSRGVFNDRATVQEVTCGYARAGASALSVLTDGPSFGGSADDLSEARFNALPILRKEFILDPYQLAESRAMGDDAILLIAACLSPRQTEMLAREARELGLEVVLEIHEEEELGQLTDCIDVVGINNRNLRDFSVDPDRSIRLAQKLPAEIVRIAESGIRDVETLMKLRSAGFHGFLIGEQFMHAPESAFAFASFVEELKTKLNESESLRNDAARPGQEAGRDRN